VAHDRGGWVHRCALLAALATAALALLAADVGPAAAQVAEDAPDLILTGSSTANSPLVVGDRFAYDLTVSNQGDGRATGVTALLRIPRGLRVVNLLPRMQGGRCSVAGIGQQLRFSVVCERVALGPGGTSSIHVDVEVVAVATCRNVRMRARVGAGDEPRDRIDAANRVVVADRTACPLVSITTIAPGAAHVGDRLELTYRVQNRGSTELTHVHVADRACDNVPRRSRPGPATSLSPGRSWRFSCTVRIGAGHPSRHDASVSARDPSGAPVSASNGYVLDVLRPGVRVEVGLSPAAGVAGSRSVHRFRVTNTGDAVLHRIVVRTDGLGLVGRVGRLAPGATAVVRRAAPLPGVAGRVAWTVTVRARDDLGLGVQDSTRAVALVSAPPPRRPGTAFSGPDDVLATGILAVLLGLAGVAGLAVGREREP
jgi:hypothetical protein